MSTGGSLGYSVMTYEASRAAFYRREAESILVRLDVRASSGHDAGIPSMAQRAKKGYRPCCAVPIQFAAPSPYKARADDALPDRNAALWPQVCTSSLVVALRPFVIPKNFDYSNGKFH